MMSRVPAQKLDYLDQNGKNHEIDIQFNFLSPSLRVKIAQHDNTTSKYFKKFQADQKKMDVLKKQEAFNEELPKMLAEIEAKKPSISADELNMEKLKIEADFSTSLSDKEMEELMTIQNNALEFEAEHQINLFKLIVNMNALDAKAKKLFEQEPDDEFWQNADISSISEFNRLFRTAYKI